MAHHRLGRTLLSGCASQSSLSSRHRTFSTSSSCFKAAVPSFTPTSSPELDELFKKFRDTLFIPAWLPLEEKKLVYRPSRSHVLKRDPVVVNVGTAEAEDKFTLRPMKITDGPSTSEFNKALRLLKTEEDWKNIIPLLSGFHSSKRKVSNSAQEIIIRKAGEQGMEEIALQAVAQSRLTGLSLSNANIARTLLFAIRRKAENAGFKGPDVQRALQQATSVARLMNAPEHTNPIKEQDAKRLPSVLGMLLELQAAHTIDAFEGRDEDNGVRSYAEKLISNWPLEQFSAPSDWAAANWKLRCLVPIWNGITMALQVNEIKASKSLRETLELHKAEVANVIDECVKMVEGQRSGPTTVVKWCKSLYK